MEEFPFLPSQREDGDEGEQNDRHGKEDGPTHELRGGQHRLPDRAAITDIDASLLQMPEGVLRHNNAGIHQHPNSNRNARQRHDVRRDVQVIQDQKRAQHRERQWKRHDEDAAEVRKENDMRQRHEKNLLDQCVA